MGYFVEHVAPDAAGVTQTAAVADVAAQTRPVWQSLVVWHAAPAAAAAMHFPQPVVESTWQTLLAHCPGVPHVEPTASGPGVGCMHAVGGSLSNAFVQLSEPYAAEHASARLGVSLVFVSASDAPQVASLAVTQAAVLPQIWVTTGASHCESLLQMAFARSVHACVALDPSVPPSLELPFDEHATGTTIARAHSRCFVIQASE
jgi:hypothetical protein